ncbi:hypothetical protein [Actinomadura sp. K4S16]|uniref:hypothetical protein n=1 Tax=Actinomadura sp. K4S16 TaxID=1316147 RepID=UPI0011EC8719|nr:hypothetical protein [Actinomadura sp. K4S16]
MTARILFRGHLTKGQGLQGIGVRVRFAVLIAAVLSMVTLISSIDLTPASAAKRNLPLESQTVPDAPVGAGQWYKVRGQLVNGSDIAAGATLTVKVAGVAGLPSSGVAAVAINIAAKGTSGDGTGQLIAYPSGVTIQDNTAIRFRKSIYNQNLLFLKVGADGSIKLKNDSSNVVRVYADAHGYTTALPGSTPGYTLVPLKPARIGQVSVPANGYALVSPLGKAGVPSGGVSDVLFTMSGKSSATGKLTVYESGGTLPGDTNLDYGLSLLVQNQVIGHLGADGKFKIQNTGTSAITVSLDAAGYLAKPSAAVTGSATLPITPYRLVNDVTVPAGGTHTVAPLGVGGVPASGVSGVYLNITNVYNQGSGVIRVYPSGTAASETHTVTFQEAMAYSGALPAKVGADGKVTVLNASSSAVRLWVDQFAYFKLPATGCTGAAAPATSAVKAAADPEPYHPTTVVQASPSAVGSLGLLELAYSDGIGRLMHGQADPSALGSIQWTPIHGQEGYYGQPALGEQADGRLNVLAHNLSGDVWSRTQVTKEPAAWGDWIDVHKPMGSTVTSARQDDTLVAFAVDGSGSLWALPQYGPNDPYQDWIDLGVSGVSTATAPIAVPVADGLRLFFLDAAGAWHTALYARGTVSGCASLSEPGFSGNASVVTYPGSRLRIFVRGTDGHILTKMQDGSGSFPQTWEQVGDLVAAGSPSAVLSPGSGKTEVVVRGTDDRIHSTGETIQGSGQWRAWVEAQPDYDTSVPATDPTAFAYSATNGPTWSFVFRTANQESRFYKPDGETTALAKTSPTFQGRALPKPPAAR